MVDQTSAAEPVPDNFLEFEDAERTPASVLTEIRERLATRPAPPDGALREFPPFAGNPAPTAGLDPALAAALDRAAELLDGWETRPVLAPSPATRLPLIGPIWARLRGAAHQLVLFYVNRQAARTLQVQRQLVIALTILARQGTDPRPPAGDRPGVEPTSSREET